MKIYLIFSFIFTIFLSNQLNAQDAPNNNSKNSLILSTFEKNKTPNFSSFEKMTENGIREKESLILKWENNNWVNEKKYITIYDEIEKRKKVSLISGKMKNGII